MNTNGWTHFESVQDFLAECRASGVKHDRNKSWAQETLAESFMLADKGDTSAVPEAEAILDRIDSDLNMSGLRSTWTMAPVGAFPNVPAFLANDPDSMWNKSEVLSPKGEINVVFSVCCSGGVNYKDAARRNIAILAAAMALQRVRPVNLLWVTTYGRADHTIKIRSNPMILSEAAYLCTSVGFMRQLSFGLASAHGWGGGWADWLTSQTNNETMIACIRKELNLSEEDIVIPPMHLDRAKDILSDPVKYINGLLDRYRN